MLVLLYVELYVAKQNQVASPAAVAAACDSVRANVLPVKVTAVIGYVSSRSEDRNVTGVASAKEDPAAAPYPSTSDTGGVLPLYRNKPRRLEATPFSCCAKEPGTVDLLWYELGLAIPLRPAVSTDPVSGTPEVE